MSAIGRIGRFCQSWILARFHPVLEYLPIESLIKERQSNYYAALEKSDRLGDSTPFIEFSLQSIRDALKSFLQELKPAPETAETRLALARAEFGSRTFTRRAYILLLKTVSTATGSRDLAYGVSSGLLKKTGTKATAEYRFLSGSGERKS